MAQYRIDTHQKYEQNSKTIYEMMMLADENGNIINGSNPTGAAVDAFGRARSSQPYTLFDSFHRYGDNGKINQSNSVTGATVSHNANAGLVECTLNTAAGSFVYRESSRVFAYQPGKSLQILQTYVLNPHKTGLRQRYGYFSKQNGVFLERDDNGLCWVERSTSSGTGVTETRVYQSNWNYDKLNGAGVSRQTLDMNKAQIQFLDIEWLGLGSVRCGFVIDGVFRLAHTFHHANIITSTYMATACLPVRAEIENVGATSSNSTLKIVCSTVISEGGYEPRGKIKAYGMPVAGTPKDLGSAGVITPVLSIRLKDAYEDAIVLIRALEFFGVTNNSTYRWQARSGGTLTGASWQSYANDSPVEYDITATAITGGTELRSEYLNVSSGAGASLSQVSGAEIFRYQLERNSFAASNKGIIYTIAASGSASGQDAIAGIQWEEVT